MAKGSSPRSPRRLDVSARKASKSLLDSTTLRGFRETTQRVVFAFLAGGAIAMAKMSCSLSSSLFSSLLTTIFLSLSHSPRCCLSINYQWRAPCRVGAACGRCNHSFCCVNARCIAPTFFSTSSHDDRCPRGTSHACPLPRDCLFFIVAFAFRLSESASTAATIAIFAIIITVVIVSSTIQSIIVALRAISELASHVAQPARLALLAEVARELFFCTIAQTIDLGTFERAIIFF